MPTSRERFCVSCGAEWGPRDYCCPACGGELAGDDIPLELPAPAARDGTVAGPLAGLLDIPPGEVACFVGPPGVGKTSLAFLTLPGCDVVSTEMGAGALRRYRERLGVPAGRYFRPGWDEEERRCVLPRSRMEHTGEVLFDSISRFPDGEAAMRALTAFCGHEGARGIAILHETKDGKAWGASSLLYDGWATVRCRFWRNKDGDVLGGVARVDKNRSGPSGSRTYTLAEA